MTLDFTNLTTSQKKYFDECYNKMQDSFVNLIDKIDENSSNSVFKYFQTIFSRSILESELVYNCNVLFFLNSYLNKKNNYNEIIVKNSRLKKILKSDNRFNGIKIICKTNNFEILSNKYLYIIIRNLPFAIMSILSSNLKRKIYNSKNLIILDTFITSSMIKNAEFTDRYYTNIESYIETTDSERLYYLPTLPLYFTKKQINKILTNTKYKFILKQDYLEWKDYLRPYKQIRKIKLLKNTILYFSDFDITSSIKFELNKNLYKSYRAILDLIFVEKFHACQNSVTTFVNWNENRSTGKALTYGFYKFGFNNNIKGYQGFQSSADYHFYLCPTNLEIKNYLIPNEIYVIGTGFIDRLYKFTNNINIKVAPSFRQAKFVKKVTDETNNNKIRLILLLSSDNTCIEYFFTILNDIYEKIVSIKNLELYIKPHPISNVHKIKKIINNLNLTQINFIDNLNIEQIIVFSDLVIGIKTGSLLEFVNNGIPSIVVADNEITENPIPDNFPKELWKLTYTSEELLETLIYFIKKINEKKINIDIEQIRSKYYTIPTEYNVKSFLSLN